MNVTEITKRGKQFIVLTQPFDTTSSAGMLMMQILGAFAEFEREIIRERTMAGLDRARAQGKILGRPRKAIKKGGRVYSLQEPQQQTGV
jgi:DNA invertase Pin-like site-specific DNA recombinase